MRPWGQPRGQRVHRLPGLRQVIGSGDEEGAPRSVRRTEQQRDPARRRALQHGAMVQPGMLL